jgi:adenylate cyclase
MRDHGSGNVRYLFESYALDTDRRELRLGADLVRVEPQVFDVLAYLIQNRERVVSKDDLLASIWEGRSVSESALTSRINAARRAIGDSGDRQRLIKTLLRKGFRFVGAAQELQQKPAAAVAEHPALVLALPDRPSIAVLPFMNMSGDAEQEYIADGIVEDITTELSRFRELFVIARNSSFHYKDRAADVRQVGRELGVRYVLEGSIRRDRDRLRISAQLIDVMTGAHLWAERYDRDMRDVFAVQDEVARTVAAILAAHVGKAEAGRTLLKPPASWQAYDHYLRAADALTSYSSSADREELSDARRFLQRALAIDSHYARAHAALSMTYVSYWVHRWDDDGPWPAALERAYQSAHKAVQLAPDLPEAHVALGWVLLWKRHHEAAVAEFERASVLNPNFTDWRFPFTLVFAGEPTRAIRALDTHMRLDPFYEPYAPATSGLACYMLKRYAEALSRLRECTSRAPNMRAARVWLAATYAQLGELDNARAEADAVLRVDPSYTITGAPPVTALKRLEDIEHISDGLRKAGLPMA